MTGSVAAALALGAAVIAPGWALARGLRLSRDPLVVLAISVALGRLLFAAVTLVATNGVGRPLLVLHALAGVAAAMLVALLPRYREELPAESRLSRLLPAAVAAAAALWLVHAFVARSGLVGAGGEIVFYGRDSTNDPLVYGSMALRLAADGLPLLLPFAGGEPALGSYAPCAMLAGLHLLTGAPILDLAFRVVPAFDAVTMTLAGVALVRALGGGPVAAAAGGGLLALGSEASFLVGPAGALFGARVQPLDSWSLFGPYLAAFNPVTPALQTFFAAAALLSGMRGGSRVVPIVAGLLVAALFEVKVFLWAPALGGLVAAALWPPSRAMARPQRLAALVAALGSLPSILHRVGLARVVGGRDETGFHLCVGCLPRYLAEAAWGSHDLSFALFRTFRSSDLLDPGTLAVTLFVSIVVGFVALGARWFALPVLWRGAAPDGGRAAAFRWLGFASLLGLGAAATIVTKPHYLNGAQFAWIATFGLWPLVGLALEGLVRARRYELGALLLALALFSTADVFVRLGYGAPIWQRVSAPERELLAQLPALSERHDVVLEPSMLSDTDRPSPIPWVAGRAVSLSLLSAVASLPEAERDRRFEELLAVFYGSDREAAARALATSGAHWVYAPSGWSLRFSTAGLLEPVLRSPAGTLYRVQRPGGPGATGELTTP